MKDIAIGVFRVYIHTMEEKKVIQMQLRIPGALRDQMKEAAAEDNRSINGEIIEALERFLEGRKRRKA